MTIVHAIILAIVEGLSEFLPISSTGHLILASELLGLTQTAFVNTFVIFIQIGAIGAVMVLYWRRLLTHTAVMARIAVAFLPTAIIGFLLYPLIKGFLIGNGGLTALALFSGGVFFLIIELFYYKEKEHDVASIQELSYLKALLIGLWQSLAVIPGVSRAGATIIGGLILGTKRKTAVEFSFLLAVPTMIAATGYDFLQNGSTFTQEQYILLGIGTLASFIVALLAIKTFLAYIQQHSFLLFGVYRIVVSVLFWFFVLR